MQVVEEKRTTGIEHKITSVTDKNASIADENATVTPKNTSNVIKELTQNILRLGITNEDLKAYESSKNALNKNKDTLTKSR